MRDNTLATIGTLAFISGVALLLLALSFMGVL